MPNKYKYFPQNKDELIKLVSNKKIKLSNIDISKVDDFSELFSKSQRTDFSGIENWNVSHVTNMSKMFKRAVYFNSDLNNWNVSNVKDMSCMFCYADKFNGNISLWDTSQVEDMSEMFAGAKNFNQDISSWNVSHAQMRSSWQQLALKGVPLSSSTMTAERKVPEKNGKEQKV